MKIPVPEAVVAFEEVSIPTSSARVEPAAIVLEATALGSVMFRAVWDEVEAIGTEIIGPTKPKFKVSFLETGTPVGTAELSELKSKVETRVTDAVVAFEDVVTLTLSLEVELTSILPEPVLFRAAGDEVEAIEVETVKLAKLKEEASFDETDVALGLIGPSELRPEVETVAAEPVVKSKEAATLASGMTVDNVVVLPDRV